jgi:hypothetical protein
MIMMIIMIIVFMIMASRSTAVVGTLVALVPAMIVV